MLQNEGQQQENEMQRAEIRRLREQVHVLLSHSGATGAVASEEPNEQPPERPMERPQSSQDARTPSSVPRNPRAQSALR